MMRLVLVGLNHRAAPLEVRERLAFGPERLATALRELRLALQAGAAPGEVAILSTCNRTEAYACAAEEVDTAGLLTTYLARYGRLERSELAPYLYVLSEDEAAGHLLRVAAGLDSLVVGECEILGQVRVAYEAALQADACGPMISALFRSAIITGKRVRSETQLGRTAPSVAGLVVELATELLGGLAAHKALLIGAGKMSALTGRALVAAGLRCVLVANRTFDRAEKLAAGLGGLAVHFDALHQHLAGADIIVCSTSAPHAVLHRDELARALGEGLGRPVLVVDLAVPRDVEPEVGDLPGVRLLDVDDLQAAVLRQGGLAEGVREAAEAIVAEEAAKLADWRAERSSVPVIRALQRKADGICQAELERALRRMGELTPHQQRAVEAMAHAIAGKLLHDPVTQLKRPPAGIERGDYAELAAALFGLHDEFAS